MINDISSLPNDTLYNISNFLYLIDKKSLRLCNKQFACLIKKISIYKLIIEQSINNLYIKLDKTYIPIGLIISWSIKIPILNYYDLNINTRKQMYWLAIKCSTIYNIKFKDNIILWANNHREKFIV